MILDAVRVIEFEKFDVTNVHPLALVFMLAMFVLVASPKRTRATFALLAVCLLMPMEQRVVVGGLDFSLLRIITIVAFVRILMRGEFRGFGFGTLDRLFLFWVVSTSTFFLMRTGMGELVYMLGISFDALMSYFVMRALVRTRLDVFLVWQHLVWIVVFLSPFIIYENITRHNVFGMFNYDGFDIAVVRDGRVRASGPLSHPILLGTLGSCTVPVFFGMLLAQQQKKRVLATVACIAATTVTLSSGSSGPVLAWGVAAFGWLLWPFRRRMRVILWIIFFLLVVLHFIREKPVWHLLLRLSTITGGTGSHRYALIDAFVENFSEWAVMGSDNVANWGWGLQDVTNQYVAEGVNGGFVTFILFILVLVQAFKQLRLARIGFERIEGAKSPWVLFAWGCSVSLAVHAISFISVTYFGQFLQFFFFFVATLPAFRHIKRPKRVETSVRPSPSPEPQPAPGLG